MKAFLLLSLLLTPLPALAQLADPTWISVWEESLPVKPGTYGEAFQMNRQSSDVDVKSFVKSKGVTYFRWRFFLASKNNMLCKTDQRICDGKAEAIKCSTNQWLTGGKWVTLKKATTNEPFIAAAQFACGF